jgi:hypothetical protein
MREYDLSQFIGKEVSVKGCNGTIEIDCILEGVNALGLVVTATEKASVTPHFRNRFYPWLSIQYVDLSVPQTTKSRVA